MMRALCVANLAIVVPNDVNRAEGAFVAPEALKFAGLGIRGMGLPVEEQGAREFETETINLRIIFRPDNLASPHAAVEWVAGGRNRVVRDGLPAKIVLGIVPLFELV